MLCLVAACVSVAEAQISQPHTDKVDAVLILDASASMRLTDPNRLRQEGAKLFVQYLQEGDRLAILEFAAEAETLLPLSDFDPAQIEQVGEVISSTRDDGIYANLYLALEKGKEILEQNSRDEARKIIIVLSDGMIEPDPEDGTAEEVTQNLFEDLVPELRQSEIVVHTLGFSEIVDPALLKKLAQESDGVNWFTATSEDLHQSFAELFLVVKKPQVVPLTSKGFRVDEDVEEATFYINNEGAESIFLVSPDNDRYHSRFVPDGMTWFKSSRFDVITISDPAPGMWEILGLPTQDGFATVLTKLRLLTDWPAVVMAETPQLLQARLYEEDKPVVLPEMAELTNYGFQIIPSDRVSEPIYREALFDDGSKGDQIADDGIFSHQIKIDQPGEYELRIVARGPTFERQQVLPFRVRPRMVSLEVESEDSEQSSVGDLFKIKLSSDALIYKEIEVKLQATSQSRKIYQIPLKEVEDQEGLYQASARLLPEEGEYQIQADFKAQDRRGKRISASSQELTYRTEHAKEQDLKVVQIEAPDPEVVELEEEQEPEEQAPVEPSGPNPFLWGFIVLLTQGGLGFFFLKKLASSQSQVQLNPGDLQIGPGYDEQIAKLEEKAALTEVDLGDPIFQNLDAPRKKKVVEDPSPAAQESQEPAESEEDATEQPPSGEESDQQEPPASPPADEAEKQDQEPPSSQESEDDSTPESPDSEQEQEVTSEAEGEGEEEKESEPAPQEEDKKDGEEK